MSSDRRAFLLLISAGAAATLTACAAPTGHPVPPADLIGERVKAIIETIVALPPGRGSIDRQGELFDELIGMGPTAVPAIIALLDDRRPLPVGQISLVNLAPDAFEGRRHYGPKLMVEALAAVLNHITGQHFGFIYNGATESERASAVIGWREWLRANPNYPAEP